MQYKQSIVLAYFKQMGLPYCVPEFTFCEGRKWRWDFAFVDQKLALEVQGGLFMRGRHTQGAAMLKEYDKLNAGTSLGWRVLFAIPQELCMMDTVKLVKKCLEAK